MAELQHRLSAPVRYCLLVLVLGYAQPARAGGGPENVFLVANSRSWASLTIAHHFAALRQLPATNVLYLDWPYSPDQVDITLFQERLLMPTLGAIQQRGIGPQIDYIVYSSDFPWAIDFKALMGKQQLPPQMAPTGSLTSLTFFAGNLIRGDGKFLTPNANNYMRRATADKPEIGSHGFRNWYGFGADGSLLEGGGSSYVLSTMLGVTSNYGMSVEEVVTYLRRSATADGTKPAGTIYFCKTGDAPRSGTREPVFASAVAALKKLGVRAEIVSGKLPAGKKEVAGVLTGARNYEWSTSQSKILPGAICENLTSFGGLFAANDNQTRLTEFLVNGAAGSSGTVCEPFAIAEKFPSAFVQVHYARGCTLAESFYQAVASPYQLLIVGDPLCRPWANIPTVTATGVNEGATIKGTISLRPDGESAGKPLDRFELYAGGVQASRCAAQGTLELDTTGLPDGDIELRVVGIEAAPIESQGRLIIPVRVDNHGRKIEFECTAKEKAHWGEPFTLKAKAVGAQKIVFYEGNRVVGFVEAEHGEVEVSPEKLGAGPVVLTARGFYSELPKDAVVSTPVKLSIEPSARLAARKLRAGMNLAAGLQFKAGNGPLLTIPATNDKKWLEDTKIKPEEPFVLAAIFEVPADGLYQFEVKHVGPLSLKVDGQSLYDDKQKEPLWSYLPVPLGKGFHQFEMKSVGGQPTGLEVRFGNSGVTNLDGKQFRHPAAGK